MSRVVSRKFNVGLGVFLALLSGPVFASEENLSWREREVGPNSCFAIALHAHMVSDPFWIPPSGRLSRLVPLLNGSLAAVRNIEPNVSAHTQGLSENGRFLRTDSEVAGAKIRLIAPAGASPVEASLRFQTEDSAPGFGKYAFEYRTHWNEGFEEHRDAAPSEQLVALETQLATALAAATDPDHLQMVRNFLNQSLRKDSGKIELCRARRFGLSDILQDDRLSPFLQVFRNFSEHSKVAWATNKDDGTFTFQIEQPPLGANHLRVSARIAFVFSDFSLNRPRELEALQVTWTFGNSRGEAAMRFHQAVNLNTLGYTLPVLRNSAHNPPNVAEQIRLSSGSYSRTKVDGAWPKQWVFQHPDLPLPTRGGAGFISPPMRNFLT